MITVIIGTGLLGIAAGVLGVFALLAKQSLLGDAISHAALPGIAFTFLITNSTNPVWLLFGGAIAGAIGTVLMELVITYTSLKRDAILGIILSVFFGFGLVLITIIQKYPIAKQALLNRFLFGNASTLLQSDLYTIGTVSFLSLFCIVLFWKECKLLTFDAQFTTLVGFSTTWLRIVLTTLLVLVIVVGLQTIGVILMSSMIIAPAAAARQWTVRLETMTLLAACIGATASIIGALLSSSIERLPTGPTIVIILSTFVFVSLVFGRKRTGTMW